MAVLSPSFAAPGMFPKVFELGLERLRSVFELEPVEYPTTRKLGASANERAADLVAAFSDPQIKAVIATIGGNDQVTYVKDLPSAPFVENPKPFFGYSDSSHFCNFLFLHGIPSYYGGSIMTQYAMQGAMDAYTVDYLKHALFAGGKKGLQASDAYNDQGHNWNDDSLLHTPRPTWPNPGHIWDGTGSARGVLWGGCLESVDDMLRHAIALPSLEQFEDIVLMLETSEGLPEASYVSRVIRALGERGILERINGLLVGRPKAWEFDKPNPPEQKEKYRTEQQQVMRNTVRLYNKTVPIVQNMNFGHTDPQIPMPYGGEVTIDCDRETIVAVF